MRISVVIPVYNRRDLIESCLNSVLNQTVRDYEVIVVDDGSTDGTRDVLKQYSGRVTLIFNEANSGVSFARNRGVAASRGQFVAMTDSDCIVEPTWLEEIVKPFALDPAIRIVGGHINDIASKNYWQMVHKGISGFVAHRSGYVRQVVGGNIAFHGDFIKANPYDECFKHAAGDDTELCYRCLKLGHKIYYTKQAMVSHHHRADLVSSLSQQFRYGYAIASIKARYKEFPWVNYGSLLLAAAVSLLIAAVAVSTAWLLPAKIAAGLFLVLTFYFNVRAGAKTVPEVVVTYPAYTLLFLAFCAGNFYFIFNCLRNKTG